MTNDAQSLVERLRAVLDAAIICLRNRDQNEQEARVIEAGKIVLAETERLTAPIEGLETTERDRSNPDRWHKDDLSLAARAIRDVARLLAHANAEVARAEQAGLERAASYLDGCALDFNRMRDPGMANHCRAKAKAIRALLSAPEKGTTDV